MKSYYNKEPEPLQYMPLPDGKADVWIRKNIREAEMTGEEAGEGIIGAAWEADEVYFRTSLDKENILARMDELYENGGEPIPVKPKEATTEERLDAIEDAISELAEVIANG